MLECSFPVNMANMVFHLMHHVPEDMVRLGSVYGYWMYPFERFQHWLKSRALLNRRYPESTVIEAYSLFDAAEFLATSGATGASEGDDELLRSAMNIATTLQGGQQVLCITTFWYRNAIIQTLLTIQIRSFGKSTQVQIIAGKVGTHRYHICRASCKLFLGHFLFNVVHTYIAAK